MKYKKYIQIALIGIGIVSLLNVIFLAATANPHLGHLFQGVVSVIILTYGLILPKLNKFVHVFTGLGATIIITIMIFLSVYGNISRVEFNEDVVIVLGAGLHGEQVTSHLARRLDAAVVYFEKNPNSYILVCGGLGDRQMVTEAFAMKQYLVESGIPSDRIIKEELSTSTYENLYYARIILNEKFSGDFIAALITNDFHIYRAARLADYFGLEVNTFGATTPLASWILNYLRESIAVLQMWIKR